MRQSSPQEIADMFKSMVRPYIICSSWTVILIMWLAEMEIPPLLVGVAGTIIVEYVGERAIKRLKGK